MARQVTLTVEDGTIVADSNSFVDEAAIIAFALNRGVVLPATSDAELDAVAVLGIKASDYLKAMAWRGEVVDANQSMPWPRKNLNVTPSFAENAVPRAVIEAQLQLALIVNSGTSLLPTSSGAGILIKEKVGPIENMYSEKAGVSLKGLPILPGVTALLEPWVLGDFVGFTPVSICSIGGA